MKQNTQLIISKALEAGFSLSTGYGQETDQLMPISNTATLQKFADLILTAQLTDLVEELEGMKTGNSPKYMDILKYPKETLNAYIDAGNDIAIGEIQTLIKNKIENK